MNLGNRNSQHSFSMVPQANIQRSTFDRSFATKDTFNFDELVPMFIDEVLPGDTINLNVKHFARLAPQVRPIMDNMYLDFFFFFVPNRLTWNNWERFNGAQDDPGDSTDYLIPQVPPDLDTTTTPDTYNPVGSLMDHMGIPTNVANQFSVNALPFRAYKLIWNEWFRDQNLQNSIVINKGDGPDGSTGPILKRNKKHDYFTSMLPFPQKGPAVQLPFGGNAPVVGTDQPFKLSVGSQFNLGREIQFGTQGTGAQVLYYEGSSVSPETDAYGPSGADNTTNLVAQLTSDVGPTINEFRQAIMMQSLLELDARGGTRYVELLKAHFNVISPDFRLQRPEFLSSATVSMQQHPVAQTSETNETPQGNLAAFTTSANSGNNVGFSKSFVEHGYVIGLVQARADVTYQQGLNKMWSRETRWDFFWPKFQELGEQAVLNKEWYLQGTTADEDVAGYQERFAEYRYRPSEIKGQFRSTYAETLDVWHLAEEFGSLPALNNTFIQSNTPIERALVVPDPTYPDILMDMWFDYKHARPMMTYGLPATLGRF